MKLKDVYPDRIIDRGEGYTHNVNYCIKIGDNLYSEVEGTYTYKTKVNLNDLEGDCSCPYHFNCKHAVATYLVYKQGNFVNADEFLEHLKTLSKNDLIKIIKHNVQYNPDIALNYNLKTATNFESFIRDFTDDFSYSKMNKAKKLAPYFTFEQLVKLLQFLYKNEEEVYDILYNDYRAGYEDNPLYETSSILEEELIKKITNEKEMKQVLKIGYLNDKIIENAEKLSQYKDIIESDFSKDRYLSFLLNLEDPDIDKIKESITKDNKHKIYSLPLHNIVLAEKIADHLKDKRLLFIVAVYKEDCKEIINHLSEFDRLISEEYYLLERKLSDIVDVFIKHKLRDRNIVERFLKKEFLKNYDKKQIRYLVRQIDDYDFIKQLLDFNKKFSQNKILLERLFQLDEKETRILLISKEDILGYRHWSETVDMLGYLRKKFGRDYLIKLIKENEKMFRTSSHLKSNLKKKGIYISNVRGVLNVEIKELKK